MPGAFVKVRGAPLVGSIVPISRDALRFFTDALTRHGDRVELSVLGRRILLLSHPSDMEQVLVRDRDSYGRSAELRKLRPIFGHGLLSSEGELWRRQRNLIQPSFQHDALLRYAGIMVDTVQRQMESWRPGEVRDLHPEMMRYTREVICAVLFGESFLAGREELAQAVSTVFGALRGEILYLPVWRRLPLPRSQRWNRAVALLNRAVRQAIQTRMRSGDPGEDLLGALLQARGPAGERMSEQQLHDEILTFFLAGHETAAVSLTWALWLLACHPTVQDDVRAEVAAITEGRLLQPADYPRLRRTAAAMKEAMRLYPPVWSMGREVVRETQLDGTPIAKGTDVWLCVHRLHHDGRWFSDPERFLPERWIAQPTAAPFTYLPFGIGPRVCIGQHFATMEIVLALAATVQRFRLQPTEALPPKPSAWITLRPDGPVPLRFEAI